MWATSTDLFSNIRTTIGDAYGLRHPSFMSDACKASGFHGLGSSGQRGKKTVPKSVDDGSVSHSLMIHTLVSFFKNHIKTLDGKS